MEADVSLRPHDMRMQTHLSLRITQPEEFDSRYGLSRSGAESEAMQALESASRAEKLAQLAEKIRRLRAVRRPHTCERFSTGLAPLDEALGGGFSLGSLHELIGSCSGAATRSLALLAAARVAGAQRWIFHIDTGSDFYPPAAVRLGICLERLVVIRTRRQEEALWVGEQALRCRAVAAVVLPLRSLEAYASRRLQLAAETSGAVCFALRSAPASGHTFAATRLRCEPQIGETENRRIQVQVLKLREGRPPEPFVLELADAAGALHSHAAPGDRPGAAERRTAAG